MISKIENAVIIIISVIVAVFFAHSIVTYIDMPTVYMSNSNGACVKIETADGKTIGCENLNKFGRYEVVWVK